MRLLDENKPWQYYFEEISKIPHGSKNELALSNYIVAFAQKYNLSYHQDAMKNVIIWKEAQNCQVEDYVMLQAHLDMVCEKTSNSLHDFENDPIELIVEDGYVRANNTTLGADDGFGVAMMLSLLQDNESVMPPLECVFTVEEEIGLFGAIALDATLLRSKRMISLDGGNENFTLTSSSGGQRANIIFQGNLKETCKTGLKIVVSGLQGGHSGGDINKGFLNAIKLLASLLGQIDLDGFEISYIEGGAKDNAIPRDSIVKFVVSDLNKAQIQLEQEIKKLVKEHKTIEPNLNITICSCELNQTFDTDFSKNLIKTLIDFENGVNTMSAVFENLVESSQNLGVITTVDNKINIAISMRSSNDLILEEMTKKLLLLVTSHNATVDFTGRYPSWAYVEHSKLRDLFCKTYFDIYGVEVILDGTHGGLEAGVFCQLVKDIDIITVGPKTYGIHTPTEKMDLASFDRTYSVLEKLLNRLGEM